MQQEVLIAIYSTRADAEAARADLLGVGVPASDIRLSNDEPGAVGEQQTENHRSFWDWLFGDEAPKERRNWYESNIEGERTALSIHLPEDAALQSAARNVLESSNALEFDSDHESTEEAGIEAQRDAEPTIAPGPLAAPTPASVQPSGRNEQVIPLTKEELEVGKRKIETRRRIRTYVVERPVEQEVRLRDETVVIERRPADGVQTHSGDFQQRDVEIVEQHEEAVVGKRARADEEIVVSKRENERVETVRDNVRETKVEIDGDEAKKPSSR